MEYHGILGYHGANLLDGMRVLFCPMKLDPFSCHRCQGCHLEATLRPEAFVVVYHSYEAPELLGRPWFRDRQDSLNFFLLGLDSVMSHQESEIFDLKLPPEALERVYL